MLSAKFWWNWPKLSLLREECDFSFEQTLLPITKGCFVSSLVEIGPVVLIIWFCYYLHLERGEALHLNKLESSAPTDALCWVWLKLAQSFWRRRQKCEKFPTTTPTTDNGQVSIREARDLSLVELRKANEKERERVGLKYLKLYNDYMNKVHN